ncbi:MAG: cytochrome c [Cyclobacteriaceae bacterium]
MQAIRNYLIFSALVAFLFSCGGSTGKEGAEDSSIYEGMDSRQKIRMQQYYRIGKNLYMTHCSNCHQPDGKGLGSLYPPLAKSDYLMQDPVSTVCIIKNGLEGEIIVNGTTYNQPMPAHDNLTNIEIAEIITYISNSWGNKSGLHDVNTIEKASADCL